MILKTSNPIENKNPFIILGFALDLILLFCMPNRKRDVFLKFNKTLEGPQSIHKQLLYIALTKNRQLAKLCCSIVFSEQDLWVILRT
jgi:hypothetical protein